MLSKRERIMAITTIVVVGFLVLNKFFIGPVSGKLQQLETQKEQLQIELSEAQNLFQKRRILEKRWKTALYAGLRNEVEAEIKVGRAIDQWSEEARLILSSVKPERVASDKGLKEMTFVVVGTGTLEAVAQFLWKIETNPLPIKVKDMQLGSSNEYGRNISVQLRLSALCLGKDQKPYDKTVQKEVNDEEQV